MIFIEKNSTNPYHNLAAEEVILKNVAEDTVMLWINSPAVVLGKHQNAMAEVNHPFVREHDIPVLRRISGGGTVYHDTGNINLSIVTTVEQTDRMIDFVKFAAPISRFLADMGLNTSYYGKTNLGVNGRKFSGNAAHVFKKKVLHHGTILFDSNLDMLEKSLHPTPARITDKAVKSVRADIINLKELLPDISSTGEFVSQFKAFLLDYFDIQAQRTTSDYENQLIATLVKEKYSTPEWNYGYSPSYTYVKSGLWHHEEITLKLEVKKGIIVDLHLESKEISSVIHQKIRELFIQIPHHPQAIKQKLNLYGSPETETTLSSDFLFNLLI